MERALGVAFFLLICALGAVAQNVTVNCTSDPSPCGLNFICEDTEEGPNCTCPDGYRLTDDGECEVTVNCTSDPSPCGLNFICEDTEEGPNCTCPDGSRLTDDGECEEIYNCQQYPCGTAECRNVNYTYECYCPSGQMLVNGTLCKECEFGTWGVECIGTCGNCTDNSTTCNRFTGVCPEDEINCASNPCGANAQCLDISVRGEYSCNCTDGFILVDNYWCRRCPAGTWGGNCTRSCNCGDDGNNCNHVNGECVCNKCWSGTQCLDDVGGECVLTFLEEPNKCENNLKELFGGVVNPAAPSGTLTPVAVELMDLANSVVIQSEPDYNTVPREDVGQGPLVQLIWRVDKNQDRPNAERGVDYLREEVKLGNIRCTLIINDRSDTADITMNGGVRRSSECEETNDNS